MALVLVANAGSTSLKLRLVDEGGGGGPVASLEAVPGGVDAVGHRFVHGGERLVAPALLDDEVMAELDELTVLAPLHNGPALAVAREARRRLPGVPHVAVFDTAFHASLPDEATAYAVPERWRTDWGVRRYGFHGLSVAWSAERAARLLDRERAGLRLVVCHLGGGASATAVRDGRSLDTSMGFGPVAGLVMATRCGDLDPEVPLHLIMRRGMSPEEVERALNGESGLRGLTGGMADMREVEAAAAEGDERAARALRVYDHRLAAVVAGMAAALGGLDALVFTGGVGEGSARVREAAAARLAFLGVRIDPVRNRGAEPGATVRVLVVRAREDLVIAREVRRVIAGTAGD